MNTSLSQGVIVHHQTAHRAVLIIGNFLSASGGSRSVCEDLALRLDAAGWSVFITSMKRPKALRLADMLSTVWTKRRSYGVAQVDVYSGDAFVWAEIVCWMLQRLGKPYLLTLHGGNLPSFAQRWPQRVRRLLRSAAVVTAPSGYLLEQMEPYCTSLCLLPNPIQIERYSFRLRRPAAPRLVWLRAFHKTYNPSLGPRVIARLVQAHPDIHLTMIGPDTGDGSLQLTQRVAADLGMADHLTIIPGIPKHEVPLWLDQHDIFINTTTVDNTPVSVMEAMACGLCVISTDVGGIPYLLKSEYNALLVPPDDSEAMAVAIQRVLSGSDRAEQLSSNARRSVEHHDWSVVLPQWQALLAAVAEGK